MKNKVLFLGLDAALPDLIKKFAEEGNLPNIKRIMDRGVFSRLETIFPPLTAAAWTAIVSGAGSGTNGVPSLMVKHQGEELDHWHTSFDRREVLCETLWDVAKRLGKKTALINWPVTFPLGAITEEDGVQLAGALNPPFRYFYMPLWDVASSSLFSTRRHRCNQIPGRAVIVNPIEAKGWSNLPVSYLPPLEFEVMVPPTYVDGHKMQVLIYASTSEGYDRVIVGDSKDCAEKLTDIKVGDYGPWIIKNFNARDYNRDGRFRFQLLELSTDAKEIKLYQSSINVAKAYSVPPTLSDEAEEVAGPFMEVDDPWAFMDGWMDAETYLEQLGLHADWWGNATKYVIENKEWDLAFTWVGTIDHIEHVLYSGIEPRSQIYDPEKADWCMEMIRQVYMQVDKNIKKILENVDLDDTYVIIISDHGFTHLDWNPYVKEHLRRAGLLEYVLDLNHDDPSNLTINWEKTKCHPLEPCHAHIFINLKGRDPQGIVDPEDYEKVQEEIIRALYAMRDPVTGDNVVALAIKKNESETLGIYNGPGYDRVGDVLYAWKPGYMSHPFIYRTAINYRDGTERIIPNPELFEPAVLCGNFTGVHLALPSLHEMHAVFIMDGPGVEKYERKFPAKIIDVAPTMSKILGIDVPAQAEGGVLYDVIDRIKR